MQDRNWLHSFHAIFADQMKDDRQRKPEIKTSLHCLNYPADLLRTQDASKTNNSQHDIFCAVIFDVRLRA
jgi:hypothetical protein